jgi:hypothetical protein
MRKRCKKRNASGKEPCDICGIQFYLDEHHIRGRKIPNPNNPSNLCNICPNCHRSIHMGDIVLEGWLMTSSGYELLYHDNGEEPISEDAQVHIIPK